MFSNVAQNFRKGRTSLRPLQNLSNTLFMLPPFSMEMTRVWSSSLIQIKNVFSLLCLNEDVLDYVLIMTFQGQMHWKGQTPTTSPHTPHTKHTCMCHLGMPIMHHTRFPWHLASHEPFLHKSAVGTQVCQRGSGPTPDRPARKDRDGQTGPTEHRAEEGGDKIGGRDPSGWGWG